MFESLMRRFVSFIDPKLAKYRRPQAKSMPVKYTPRSLEDVINVIQRTPKNVLSDEDRSRIAAIMSFDDRVVSDLMVPRSELVFVKKDEILGPLVLDKLYKSGFTNFPVIDGRERVVGILHTEALNALEIKTTDSASKYMSKSVNYLYEVDTLAEVVAEIERTNSYYYLVKNSKEIIVGCFTVQLLMDYLLGKKK